MHNYFRNLIKCQLGNVGVLFALASVPIIAAVGTALDYHHSSNIKSALQQASDAAVLAAVSSDESDASSLEALARDVFAANFSARANGVTASPDLVLNEDGSATVKAMANVPTKFMGIVGYNEIEVASASTARKGKQAACVLALTPGDTGIEINGSVSINAPDCEIHSNSSDAKSITGSMQSTVDVASLCAVGDYHGNNFSPVPETGCAEHEDPFALVVPPSMEACLETDFHQKDPQHTYSPGVYCGGIKLSAQVSATFLPGTYFISDGSLGILGQTTVAGEGVTFVLVGSASIDIAGGADVTFSAPTSGSLAGFLFYQHSSEPAGQTSSLSGNTSSELTGIYYLPNQTLKLSGSFESTTTSPGPIAIVADNVKFDGSGKFSFDPNVADGIYSSIAGLRSGPILIK